MKQSRTAVRVSAAVAVLGALTMSGTAAQASPGSTARATHQAEGGRSVCGFYKTAQRAYYNHCATNSRVLVFVDRTTQPDEHLCIRPGTWVIGTAAGVNNAWYIGHTC